MLESVPTDVQAIIGLGVLAVIVTGAIVWARRHAKLHVDQPRHIRRFMRDSEYDQGDTDESSDDDDDHHGGDPDDRPRHFRFH